MTTDLLLGQFEGVEFVEEAKCGGRDAPRGHTPHASAHPGGAAASSLAGTRRPGLEVIHLVIDLVHHLVKCPHLKQLGLRKFRIIKFLSPDLHGITLKYGEFCMLAKIKGFRFIVLSFP